MLLTPRTLIVNSPRKLLQTPMLKAQSSRKRCNSNSQDGRTTDPLLGWVMQVVQSEIHHSVSFEG